MGPPGTVDAPKSFIIFGCDTSFKSWYSDNKSDNSRSPASFFNVLTATVMNPVIRYINKLTLIP